MVAARDMGAVVTAVDLSPCMIQVLQDSMEAAALPVTACVMDGQSLDLESSVFDVVHSSFGVTLFPDFRKVCMRPMHPDTVARSDTTAPYSVL